MIHGNWKKTVTRLLARTHLLPAARTLRYRLRWVTDPAYRQEERLLDQEFRKFAREFGPAFRLPLHERREEAKRVLVVSLGSLGQLVEIMLVKACELAGYRPVILMDFDRWMLAYYEEVGIRDMLYWEDMLPSLPLSDAERMVDGIRSFEHLVKADYCGARVGKYAASTALRHLRVGRLDVTDQGVRAALLPFLHRAMCYARASQDIVRTVKPHLVLSVDPGYTPRGELFDVALAAGVDTITWNAAHKNNTLMLKRYNRGNRDVHPASLSAATWKDLKERSWPASKRESLRREITGTYLSGEWYSEVGTQFHTHQEEAGEIRRALALDDRKKTAVIFPHIFWDGTFFWGTDLFSSYEEWFVETVKVAYRNTHVNWVVKIHPANIVKNARDGIDSEPSEMAAIRSLEQRLPPHVKIIHPDSRISTLSLYAVMDYCVTVRGTVGIEAASFGVPVLTAGTGRFDRLGFTFDSQTRAQYLDRLARIHESPALLPEQRELAERFAYGIFVLRPCRLQTVALEYQRDGKASLHTKVRLPIGQALATAPDVRAVAEWIQNGTEDFLDPVARTSSPHNS